jgi:hypothetical protein
MRDSIVLIQIWDYTCINCLNTLPYLRAWHQRYSGLGLKMIGVHTPEFSFARNHRQVKSAAGRLGISWPVILDNDQVVWQSLANRYWPTIYLIDDKGYIRYTHAGDNGYAQTERMIQSLLRSINPTAQFPDPISHLRHEDAPGAVCFSTTPELQINSVGNEQKPIETPAIFELPEQILDGKFYLQGWWQTAQDGFTLVGDEGAILLKYHAATAYGVFAPSADPVEHALGIIDPILIQINQDGETLNKYSYSEDLFELDGLASLRITEPRCYTLLRNSDVRPHELLLNIKGSGFTFYAFSFGTCVDPSASSKG